MEKLLQPSEPERVFWSSNWRVRLAGGVMGLSLRVLATQIVLISAGLSLVAGGMLASGVDGGSTAGGVGVEFDIYQTRPATIIIANATTIHLVFEFIFPFMEYLIDIIILALLYQYGFFVGR